MQNVKCRDCGYLSMRMKRSRNPVAATDFFLQWGQFTQEEEHVLLCYKEILSFEVGGVGSSAKLLLKLSEELQCPEFRRRIRAKSPKEHEEMTIIERLEAINKQHREDDIARQEKWNRRNFQWLVISAGSALIAAIAAVFAYVRH